MNSTLEAQIFGSMYFFLIKLLINGYALQKCLMKTQHCVDCMNILNHNQDLINITLIPGNTGYFCPLSPTQKNMDTKYKIKWDYVDIIFFNALQDLGILKNTSKVNIF